jgi:hypothetical protein
MPRQKELPPYDNESNENPLKTIEDSWNLVFSFCSLSHKWRCIHINEIPSRTRPQRPVWRADSHAAAPSLHYRFVKRKIQTVCKPGSVHAANGAGRPFLWDGPCGPPRATNPGDGSEMLPRPCFRTAPAAPIRSCSRWGLPCQPCHQGRGALLPHRFTLAPGKPVAVCFLWHCPWGRPRRLLAGTVFPWSPDFPPAGFTPCQRPSNRLDETVPAPSFSFGQPGPAPQPPGRWFFGPPRRSDDQANNVAGKR